MSFIKRNRPIVMLTILLISILMSFYIYIYFENVVVFKGSVSDTSNRPKKDILISFISAGSDRTKEDGTFNIEANSSFLEKTKAQLLIDSSDSLSIIKPFLGLYSIPPRKNNQFINVIVTTPSDFLTDLKLVNPEKISSIYLTEVARAASIYQQSSISGFLDYTEKIDQYYRNNLGATFKLLKNEALKIIKNKNDFSEESLANANVIIGNKGEAAVIFYKEAQNAIDSFHSLMGKDKSEIYKIYIKAAHAYFNNYDYKEALNIYEEINTSWINEEGGEVDKNMIRYYIAKTKSKLSYYNKDLSDKYNKDSEGLYRLSLDYFIKNPASDPDIIPIIRNNLANLLSYKKTEDSFNEALSIYKNILNKKLKKSNPILFSVVSNNQSAVLIEKYKCDSSNIDMGAIISSLEELLRDYQNILSSSLYFDISINLSKAMSKKGNCLDSLSKDAIISYKKSINILEKSLAHLSKRERENYIFEFGETLAAIYTQYSDLYEEKESIRLLNKSIGQYDELLKIILLSTIENKAELRAKLNYNMSYSLTRLGIALSGKDRIKALKRSSYALKQAEPFIKLENLDWYYHTISLRSYNNLLIGEFYDDKNYLLKSKDLIQLSYAHDPNNPVYIDSLGWVEYRLGNIKKSESLLREAVKKAENTDRKDRYEAQSHLVELLYFTGREKEARTLLNSAIRANPTAQELLNAKKLIDK